MKNTSTLIHKNIENLTNMWKEVALSYSSFVQQPLFNYATAPESQWPNRLWLNQEIDEKTIIFLKNTVLSKHPSLVIPYWDIYNNESQPLFEKNGFVKTFQQIGMSLELTEHFNFREELTIQLVTTPIEAKLWCKLFKMAFGYTINADILTNTLDKINYYIASCNGKEIGTAITYTANNTVGIHALGIIHEARKKGYAEQFMCYLLNISIDQKYTYAVLQASDMGKGIYLKLGFEVNFLMKNYALT